MAQAIIGGQVDLGHLPGVAPELWGNYGTAEQQEWAQEAKKRGFSSGHDAFLNAAFVALTTQEVNDRFEKPSREQIAYADIAAATGRLEREGYSEQEIEAALKWRIKTKPGPWR